MNAKTERFAVVSFTPISETYFVVHLQMSPGNEHRGIMGIRADHIARTDETITITEGMNRPARQRLCAELSLKDRTGWIAYL